MSSRTIVLTERQHEVLMHALDCAGCWSFEDAWESDDRHVLLMSPIAEPLDSADELVELREVCRGKESR